MKYFHRVFLVGYTPRPNAYVHTCCYINLCSPQHGGDNKIQNLKAKRMTAIVHKVTVFAGYRRVSPVKS